MGSCQCERCIAGHKRRPDPVLCSHCGNKGPAQCDCYSNGLIPEPPRKKESKALDTAIKVELDDKDDKQGEGKQSKAITDPVVQKTEGSDTGKQDKKEDDDKTVEFILPTLEKKMDAEPPKEEEKKKNKKRKKRGLKKSKKTKKQKKDTTPAERFHLLFTNSLLAQFSTAEKEIIASYVKKSMSEGKSGAVVMPINVLDIENLPGHLGSKFIYSDDEEFIKKIRKDSLFFEPIKFE